MTRAWVMVGMTMVMTGCRGDSPTTPPPSTDAAPNAPAGGAPAPANRPPAVTINAAEPGTALLRVTRVSLAAESTDADGDALSYTWDFGDGATEKGGGGIAHVFDKAGDLEVAVTVDDGRGGTASARRTLRVATLSGTWHGLISPGAHGGWRIGGNLAQTGRTFQVDTIAHTGDGTGDSRDFHLSAVLLDPFDMVVTVPLCGDVTFRGSWNDRLDTFIGDGSGCNRDFTRIEMYR